MRQTRLLLLLFFAGCSGTAVLMKQGTYTPPAPKKARGPKIPDRLTLDAAEAVALSNAPAILAAEHALAASKAAVSEAQSARWPTISTTYGYWQRDPRQGMVMSGEIPLPPPMGPIPFSQEVYMGERGYAFFNAQAQMALWTFGAVSAAIKAAKADESAAGKDLQAARFRVRESVRKAFFAALLAERGLEVTEKALEAVKERVRQVEALFEAGMATEFDLRAVKAALAEVDAAVVKARAGAQTAHEALAAAMGLPPRKFQLVAPRFRFPNRIDVEKLATLAVSVNPSLQALRKRYLALWHRRRAAYAAHFPSIILTGAYNWADDETLIDKGFGEVRVMLTWDLFTGGKTTAQIRRLDEGLKQMAQTIREVKSNLRVGVFGACAKFLGAKSEARAAEEALEKARTGLRQKEAEFQEGAATAAELVSAEVEVMRAKLALLSARLKMAEALTEIETLVGQTLWRITD